MKSETRELVVTSLCRMDGDICQTANIALWASNRMRTLIEMMEDNKSVNIEYVRSDLLEIRDKMVDGVNGRVKHRINVADLLDSIDREERTNDQA